MNLRTEDRIYVSFKATGVHVIKGQGVGYTWVFVT